MEKDLEKLYKQLKKDYLELERAHQDEREGLLKVINAFGVVLRSHGELEEEYRAVESVVNTEEALPLDLIEKEVSRLKDRIIEAEREQEKDDGEMGPSEDLHERLLETCRTIKRMMIPVLEDFYPLNAELAAKAGAVDIDCQEELAESSLQEASSAFLAFVGDLRVKISEDFSYINRAFLTLLDEVKELELTLTAEFGGDRQLKQIEYFEMKMSAEMGSIADSFDIHSTIIEIKNTVTAKIENIKKLVTLKRQEETKKEK